MFDFRANPDQPVASAEKLDPSNIEWIKVSVTIVAAMGLSLFFVLALVFALTPDTVAHPAATAASMTRNQFRILHEAAMIDPVDSYDVDVAACRSGAATGTGMSADCVDATAKQHKTPTHRALRPTD